MPDLRTRLNQRAERGELRGAAAVYRSAKEHTDDAPRFARAASVSPSKWNPRRRRQLLAAAVVAVSIVVALSVADSGRRQQRVVVAGPGTTRQAFATQPGSALFWLDQRGLVEGNPKSGVQRRLSPATRFCQACPGVRVGRYVFLVQPRILRVDTTDGSVRDLGPGVLVFPHPDAVSLYVVLSSESTAVTTTTVIDRIDVDGHVLGGPWTVPHGQVLTGPPRAVVGGVLTQTDENAADHTLSVWNPETALRSVVGSFRDVVDTYTAANATTSLIAYTGARCDTTGCGLTIASVPGGRSHQIVAPDGAPGFIGGGAFSPDGDQLAAFVDRLPEAENPGGDLVIVTMATATADRIAGSTVGIGEPYGFAAWSADSRWVYFGGLSSRLKAHYRDTPDAIDLALPASYSIVAGPATIYQGSP